MSDIPVSHAFSPICVSAYKVATNARFDRITLAILAIYTGKLRMDKIESDHIRPEMINPNFLFHVLKIKDKYPRHYHTRRMLCETIVCNPRQITKSYFTVFTVLYCDYNPQCDCIRSSGRRGVYHRPVV